MEPEIRHGNAGYGIAILVNKVNPDVVVVEPTTPR